MKKLELILVVLLGTFTSYAQPQELTEETLDGIWLLREQEMQYQEYQFRANEHKAVRLGDVLKKLFDIDVSGLCNLNILIENQLTTLSNNKEIIDYDILAPIKFKNSDDNLRFNGCDYILTVSYNGSRETKDKSISNKEQTIILHINNASGIYGKSVYKSVTVSFPFNLIEKNILGQQTKDRTINFLIAYDYQTEEQATQQYYNIINSINNKLEMGQDSILTPTELDLLNNLSPELEYNFYMGKKVMRENRYVDAINYLSLVFDKLNTDLYMGEYIGENLGDLYRNVSFLIGYNYMELGSPEKALRYLDFPSIDTIKGYHYREEYISCLISLKDFRAIYLINRDIEMIEKNTITEKDKDYYLFLNRRKAYILVDQKQYEEALKALNKVLTITPDDKIALEEMKYIQEQLGKQEEERSKL